MIIYKLFNITVSNSVLGGNLLNCNENDGKVQNILT